MKCRGKPSVSRGISKRRSRTLPPFDNDLDRDNTSIENQKAIIEDFVKHKFPGSRLTFYKDRDRSGYTFEQREEFEIAPTEVGIV